MLLVFILTQRFHSLCFQKPVLLPWIINSFSLIFKAEKVSIMGFGKDLTSAVLSSFQKLISDRRLRSVVLVTDQKIWFLGFWQEQNMLGYLT